MVPFLKVRVPERRRYFSVVLVSLWGDGGEEVGQTAREVRGAVLHALAGGGDFLVDGRDLLVGQSLQTVVLAALVGDLADGPVGTAVVGDAERGALALCDGAEVDLLQLVQRGSRQQLGLLRGGGLCVCLLGSEGRGGLIAHCCAPFSR